METYAELYDVQGRRLEHVAARHKKQCMQSTPEAEKEATKKLNDDTEGKIWRCRPFHDQEAMEK